jgi:GNAT superfamily N-acetyltransferase
VIVREAEDADWQAIWPFLHEIVAAGDSFSYDPGLTELQSRQMWMVGTPGRTVVAVYDQGPVVGTANMYANRPGPGAHIASGNVMVDGQYRGRGIGRRLLEYVVGWSRTEGFQGIQFNAVAASNVNAVGLYESLGFTVVGTVPGAFRHPALGDVGLHIMFKPL